LGAATQTAPFYFYVTGAPAQPFAPPPLPPPPLSVKRSDVFQRALPSDRDASRQRGSEAEGVAVGGWALAPNSSLAARSQPPPLPWALTERLRLGPLDASQLAPNDHQAQLAAADAVAQLAPPHPSKLTASKLTARLKHDPEGALANPNAIAARHYHHRACLFLSTANSIPIPHRFCIYKCTQTPANVCASFFLPFHVCFTWLQSSTTTRTNPTARVSTRWSIRRRRPATTRRW
jgi:hypothetical protein